MLKRAVVFCFLIFGFVTGRAQTIMWPSPEVEQMYKQAKEYLSKGAISQAVVLFQQAIQLAPDVTVLYRDLSQALYLAKDYEEAYRTLEPVIGSGQADEQSYQLAASALIAMEEKKKARAVLEKGIARYPSSGLLYYQLGKYYESMGDPEYALDSWLQGIQGDPAYHLNYYEAARSYMNTEKAGWAILYGEIFINMERQTNRSMETRKLVLDAYRKLSSTIGTGSVPKYGTPTGAEDLGTTFENAVRQVFLQLSPVLSDGVTTDNLTMFRTRFAMDWMLSYAGKYPFSLFTYHDRLLRDGHFEAYNQWLFGRAENINQYDAWVQFHKTAIPSMEGWAQTNQLRMTASDFYNDKDLRTLFPKKKKKG